MSDAIVRLLLNTAGFDSNLQRARRGMRDFSSDGGSLNTVFKGLGGTIAKLTGGITAAGAAIKTTKDAFMQSESNIDEWGRTIEGAKGAYNTFLDTLNGGNWSAFFENLGTAVSGARDLYDALDRLSSVKANNQAAIAIAQSEIAKLRLAKQEGQKVDDQLKAAEQRLKALQMESVEAGKDAARKSLENVVRSGYETQVGARRLNQGSLDKVVNSIITRGQKFFDEQKRIYEELRKKGTVEKTTSYTSSTGQTYETTTRGFEMSNLSRQDQISFRLAKAITEGETRLKEGLTIYANAINEETASRREEFRNNRYMLQGSNKNGSGSTKEEPVFSETATSMKAMKENVSVLTKTLEGLTTGSEEYAKTLRELNYWQDRIKKQQQRDSDISNFYSGKTGQGIRLTPSPNWDLFKGMTPEQAKKMEHLDLPNQKKPEVKADDKDKGEAIKGLVGGVDTIVSSLEGLGVDVGSGFKKGLKLIQSIIAIVEGIKAIESAVQILTSGRDTVYQAAVVSELGVIATATAMTAGFQAVKAIPIIGWALKEGGVVHAAGGVVMGQNYVDRVPATLSSGEMVLNPAQQSKLFKMANSGGGEAAASQPYVNAETIVCGIQNWAKRRGKGSELVFTQR